MIRSSRHLQWFIFTVTLAGSALAYLHLPPVIAMHWNMDGVVDGTMSSSFGAFVIPAAMLLLIGLYRIVPRIQPLRENIESLRLRFETFAALVLLVLAVCQAALLAWNLGEPFNISTIILPAIGVLIFYAGSTLPLIQRGWAVGIRTPWTLASDYVWGKTHELGGRLFQMLGAIVVVAALYPHYAVVLVAVPLVTILCGLVAYSYALHRDVKSGTMVGK